MSRLRRREIIPEDTAVIAILSGPKLVFGKYGRQLEVNVRVVEGEFKGTEFKNWFSFGKDKDTDEEFISYGGALYQVLSLAAEDLDAVLEDDDMTDREYEKFLKETVKKLDGIKIMARVGVKAPENSPEKKRNFIQPGTFGPYRDPDEGFDDLDMGGADKAPAA